MVALVSTVAYLGLEARAVEVQCQVAAGMPRFAVVGLPDKAVGESRERVQAALAAMGLALPPKRITVNLSPADLPKEGSHYDLPIALALLGAMGVCDAEQLAERHTQQQRQRQNDHKADAEGQHGTARGNGGEIGIVERVHQQAGKKHEIADAFDAGPVRLLDQARRLQPCTQCDQQKNRQQAFENGEQGQGAPDGIKGFEDGRTCPVRESGTGRFLLQ